MPQQIGIQLGLTGEAFRLMMNGKIVLRALFLMVFSQHSIFG